MKASIVPILLCAAISLPVRAQNSSANLITAAGYLYPSPVTVAPGQVITLFVAGLGQGDITVTVRQGTDLAAPVLDVRPASTCNEVQPGACGALTAVTVQIPYEVWSACVTNVCPNIVFLTQIFVTQNGAAGALFTISPFGDHIHFLTTCDTVVSSGSGFAPITGLPCAPFVTHAGGSLVSASNPALGNEELVAYATGLGATNPATPTGQAASAATPTQQNFLLSFNFLANALPARPTYPLNVALTSYATPLFTGLTAGYVGLYQVNFRVPPPPTDYAPCDNFVQSNLTVNMGGQYSFDGAAICVIP